MFFTCFQFLFASYIIIINKTHVVGKELITNFFLFQIVLVSEASPNATILVDSFRYIPPGEDESLCQIYG